MTNLFREREYRKRVGSKDLESFRVVVKETDLWVSADKSLEQETLSLTFDCRRQIEGYIENNPEFATSLVPCESDPYAPSLVRQMIDASRKAGVGPMASVAGAIAQYVGTGLLSFTSQVIVENGGDVFVKVNRPVTVSVFAGDSPLSERIGLLISEKTMPMGVCASSGKIGHSLSMGIADVVCLVSDSAVLADAAATAIGNRIKAAPDLKNVPTWAGGICGIIGGVAIVGERMATWGDIELVEL